MQRFKKKILDLKGFRRQLQDTVISAIHLFIHSTSVYWALYVARLYMKGQNGKGEKHRPYSHGAHNLVYETGKREV